MKLSVLYHSKTGNTKQMAEEIAAGMSGVEGAEAKAMSISEVDEDWLKESRCIVVGTPIYFADQCAEVKGWLEGSLMKYAPMGKLGGAFATADYVHGGGTLGIRTILDYMMVLGMLTYSGGGSAGKPVIHLGPVGWAGHLDETRDAFPAYGQRMAQKALELFG